MRIGMLTDMYTPHLSGVTNHIALNKREFERRGHEVFVFTFGDLDHEDTESNIVRTWGLPYGATGYNLGLLGWSEKARRLVRTLDVAHVHHPFVSGRLALRHCSPLGIPVVFTNHTRYDHYADTYVRFVPRSLRDAFVRDSLRSFFRRVDLAISPSAGMLAVLRGLGVDSPVEIVPNGIDLRPFAEAAPVSRAALGLSDDDVVLAFLGRLGEEKSVRTLLRAFARAGACAPALRLLLIGDGPDRRHLVSLAEEAGIRDHVAFAGLVPYAEVPGRLAAADAFVSASVTEVHPLTVIEAMATGLPVAAMRSVGIEETVRDGSDGLLADDADGLADAMRRLGEDAALRRCLGDSAKGRSRDYGIEHTAGLLLGHYRALLERAAPGAADSVKRTPKDP